MEDGERGEDSFMRHWPLDLFVGSSWNKSRRRGYTALTSPRCRSSQGKETTATMIHFLLLETLDAPPQVLFRLEKKQKVRRVEISLRWDLGVWSGRCVPRKCFFSVESIHANIGGEMPFNIFFPLRLCFALPRRVCRSSTFPFLKAERRKGGSVGR